MPVSPVIRANGHDPVDTLHSLCGIYTKPELVKRLLDRVGWKKEADLASARLLEPGAGDGEFLVEAVRRLVASFVRHGLRLDIKALRDRMSAYELAPGEANKARSRIVAEMKEMGVHHLTAKACARAWVRNEDFLLAELPHSGFTHIVGNPPYIRWSKVPKAISKAYAEKLPSAIARGDLYLPFLHRSFEHLSHDGRCAFVCSDRWRYTVYAREFRERWLTSMHIETRPAGEPADAFVRDVYVQPEILIARPRESPKPLTKKRKRGGKTLAELGCTIRVGPALGVTPAFVLEPHEQDVEPHLLHPWVDTSEVFAGRIDWIGRRVISPYDKTGTLVDLEKHPLFAAHIRRFEWRLRARYIVRNGGDWYRTIDKVKVTDWSQPKLFIPEIAKIPRVAIDRSGAIPSHGLYCVFSHQEEIEKVYDRLRDGKLAKALTPIAPKIKGHYTRCYRRFLEMIII